MAQHPPSTKGIGYSSRDQASESIWTTLKSEMSWLEHSELYIHSVITLLGIRPI